MIRESNQASGVFEVQHMKYYVPKKTRTGLGKISSLACGFSPIKPVFVITRKV